MLKEIELEADIKMEIEGRGAGEEDICPQRGDSEEARDSYLLTILKGHWPNTLRDAKAIQLSWSLCRQQEYGLPLSVP